MADIVNLRTVRKQKARDADVTRAAEHREKFGRRKADKAATKLETARSEKMLDSHKREE